MPKPEFGPLNPEAPNPKHPEPEGLLYGPK